MVVPTYNPNYVGGTEVQELCQRLATKIMRSYLKSKLKKAK
jgi:hypothetical protein